MTATFPAAWWEVAEVVLAVGSLDQVDGGYDKTLAAYRDKVVPKKGPRSGKRLKAREFDDAVRGATAAMAGKPETVASILKRARWMTSQQMVPVFARPVTWQYQPEELEVIAEAREAGLEPVFLGYDKKGIDAVPGPNTDEVKVNPWTKWKA